MLSRHLLAAAAIAVSAQLVSAQGTPNLPRARSDSSLLNRLAVIDGAVSDTNLNPLQAAFVSIVGTKIRVGTGPNGKFRITKIPPGQYLVIVKRVGYRPASAVIEVPPADTLRLAYTLEQVSVALDPVVIAEKPLSVRMGEFYARRRAGVGHFMTTEQINQVNAVYTTDVMRRFTSVNVSPSRTTSLTQFFALSHRGGENPNLGACPMQVYVDEVPMPRPFNLDLLPSPHDLAGIEVYSGSATIPPKFSGFNRSCGVILVWTKDNS